MKYTQLIAIAALLGAADASIKQIQPKNLAQTKDGPANAGTDPIVQEKKDKVTAINEEIEKKENPELSVEAQEKEAQQKLEDATNESIKSAAKSTIKKVNEVKEKAANTAEKEGTTVQPALIKKLDEKIKESEETIEKTPDASTKEADKETEKEIKELKEKKVKATKEVESEQLVIDKVKAKIDTLVNPKSDEKPVADVAQKQKFDMKGYMDKMEKEADRVEKAKEDAEALTKGPPNPATEKVKAIEEAAGEQMETTIKTAVESNTAALNNAVKKQEAKAKAAKANSNKPTASSTGTTDSNGLTSDEAHIADLGDHHLSGYIATKVKTAVKK